MTRPALDPLRLALMTPQCWPLVSEAAAHVLQLARSLQALGHRPTIVTPRWKRSWPEHMSIGSIPLVRLRGTPRGGWSTLRWMVSLRGWLRGMSRELDGAIVWGLKHEAYVALRMTRRQSFPVLLLTADDDLDWQRTATFGSRIATRCREAVAVVTFSAESRRALSESGFGNDCVFTIPRAVAIPPPSPASARDAARAALAAVNYDLVTTANSYIALALGRLDAAHRFGDLIRAWRLVTARRPEARLWIVGDGPDREMLFRQLSDLDQRFRVLLPGSFDCLDELMQASDCLLVPSSRSSPPLSLLTAQAYGLPVVAAKSEAAGAPVIHDETGLLYPTGDIKSLADAVTRLMNHPGEAIHFGAAARAAAQARPKTEEEAQAYVDLLRSQR